MATQISIAVTLDDKGVVTGVKNIEGGLQKIGQSGNVVFTGLTKQQKEAREAAMLFSETLNVQIPAGLEKIFAKIPGLSGALSGLFKVFAAGAVFAGIVEAVDHFDELRLKIRDAGYELSLFGEHMRSVFGGGDQALISAEAAKKDAATIKPLLELIQQAQDKTATVGKQGFAAVAAQGKQAIAEIQGVADKQRQVVQNTYTDEKDKTYALLLIKRNVDAAVLASQKETAATAAALARQNRDAAAKESDDIRLVNLLGAAAIIQTEVNKFAEIDRQRKAGVLSEADAAAARVNANKKADAEILKLQTDYLDAAYKFELDGQTATAKGVDKITIDALTKRYDAEKEFRDKFSGLAADDPVRIHAEQALQDKLTEIDRQAGQQRQDLERQNTEEIVQMQEKAANAALPAWARATAQIRTDYQDSLRAIDKQLADHEINEEQAQQKRQAIWQETNAKLVDEHKRVVDQMAGQIESLFSGNIADNILSLVKKFAFKIVAEFLTHFSALQNGFGGIFQKLFSGGGIASSGSGGGFSLGSLLGLGGSSSGGGAAVTGSGVNSSFIGSLGLGGSSSGFSLASLGGLAVGGAMLGIGALFSSAIGSILTPEPSKDQIAATVLQADQASLGGLQGLIQAVRDGKISDFSAMQKIQYAWGMAHNKEAYFNPGQVGDLDRSFQALLDQVKDAEIDHKRTLNPGYATGAAQFHGGGEAMAGRGLRISPTEQLAILQDGERVIRNGPAQRHAGTIAAMNDGSYSGGGHTFVIQTLDPRTMEHWLRTGGAEMIAKGLSLHISEGGPRRG